MCHFVPHGKAVTLRVVRGERPDLLNNVTILRDNPRSHITWNVKHQLERWEWDVLEHPTYYPDLSPYEFDVFLKVKEPLRGRRFRTRDDIHAAVIHEISKFIHDEAGGI